jgi:N-acetylglutamate synthase-like GNAT family acetyltransferase
MITIRLYENQDKEGIIKLILDIQQLEFQVPITLEEQPDLLIIPEFYQINSGNFWVAIDNNEVIGSIALIDCGQNIGCIRKMFVQKKYRGAKYSIAQNLLNKLTAWALEHNFENLYLGTIARLEAAIGFYMKNGFTQIAKENLPKEFPLMAVDTHFFEKNITSQKVEIIEYLPQYQKDFKEINVEWILVNFPVESADHEQLDHPERIIEAGGSIYLAKLGDEIVGTAILAYEGDGVWELGKMAVRPKAKGLGIGKMLLQKTIDEVKKREAKTFYLESNRLQEVAIKMYTKMGFVEVPLNPVGHFERVDIKMEYPL